MPLGEHFNRLGKEERGAVAEHVRAEYDKLVFQQPSTYISRNAVADPQAWQDGMCELMAGDPERARGIFEKRVRVRPAALASRSSNCPLCWSSSASSSAGVLVGQDLIRAADVRAQFTLFRLDSDYAEVMRRQVYKRVFSHQSGRKSEGQITWSGAAAPTLARYLA